MNSLHLNCLRWPAAVLLAVNVLHVQDASRTPVTPARDQYVISVPDVLNITVDDDKESTGKYTVQPDGTVTMPIIGRVPAAGRTVVEFEANLQRELGKLIRNPHVSVTLETYRGSRVFVTGAVGSPGTYSLAEGETLMQLLARVGANGAAEAIIRRSKKAGGGLSLSDSDADVDVIRVNLRDLEKDFQETGSLARNVALRDGDAVIVPRVDPSRVFVSGQVHTPGAYGISEGTTVLQALTMAGGATERAALNRISITRIENGKSVKIDKVKLTDILRPGDSIQVPERYM